MFTGIVTAVGRIVALQDLGNSLHHGKRLLIETPPGYLDGVTLGDSIALNGACMTVTALHASEHRFAVEVSAVSLASTSGLDRTGAVNLEQALRAQDRLGGHIVTGHVDGVGQVLRCDAAGESLHLGIRAPRELARFLAVKGSVCVNGVSLTVNRVSDSADGCDIDINLIAHTARNTTLGSLVAGARVNLEIDLIARYVERMLKGNA